MIRVQFNLAADGILHLEPLPGCEMLTLWQSQIAKDIFESKTRDKIGGQNGHGYSSTALDSCKQAIYGKVGVNSVYELAFEAVLELSDSFSLSCKNGDPFSFDLLVDKVRTANLTEQDADALGFLIKGVPVKDIESYMEEPGGSMKNCRSRIFRKLGIGDPVETVIALGLLLQNKPEFRTISSLCQPNHSEEQTYGDVELC